MIIIHSMELCRHFSSGDVFNQTNTGRMERRSPQKLAKLATRLPFRDLFAILEAWIKEIGGATPHFCRFEFGMIRDSVIKEFTRRAIAGCFWKQVP